MGARLGLGVVLMAGVLSGCGEDTTKVENPLNAPTNARGLNLAQIEHGRAVYEKHCLACHGVAGKGQPGDWRQRKPNGLYPPPPLDDTAHAWHHPTAVLKQAIEAGSPPDMGDMPAWKGKLSDAQIDDVIVYIKSLWSDEVYQRWLEIERNAMAE